MMQDNPFCGGSVGHVFFEFKVCFDDIHSDLLPVRCRTLYNMREDDYSPSVLHSGNPAMLVNSDKIPANTEADTTSFTSTCPSAVAVPMVAIMVCATVFAALIAAHFIQFFQFFILFHLPFQILDSMICYL